MSILEKIRQKLQEDVEKAKTTLLESVEIELTEEEKEGLSEEEQAALLEAKKKAVKEEDDEKDDEKEDGDDDDDKKENPFKKKDDKDDKDDDEEVDVKESLLKIFSGLELDEKVKGDLETLFNVVVAEKVNAKCDALSDKYEKELEEALETIEESINKYVSYAAEEWLKENTLAVEQGIRQEISENIITGIRELFVENYIDVPEEKIDIVAEAEEALEDLTKKLDETKNLNISLTEEIKSLKAQKIVNELSGELAETEKEKLSELIAEIKYEDDSSYKDKVKLVVEKYFQTQDPKSDEKKENVNEGLDDRMKSYLSHFKK